MKIITVVGTRPELIRLCVIIKKLDELLGKDHILLWTGQNYDPKLSDIFFDDLQIRKPDYYQKGGAQTFASQLSSVFNLIEQAILTEKPNKALILGDTNSSLSAMIFERHGVPVYHMEAGNRCFDEKVPEEKNRKMIDAVSSFNLPYVQNSKQNLLNENYPEHRIHVVGNPIYEVLQHFKEQIDNSTILKDLNLVDTPYAVCTLHRAENVDSEIRFNEMMKGISHIQSPIIYPIHPRSLQKIKQYNIQIPSNLHVVDPLGFFDFVKLEQHAHIALTDSGTVQEECCLFNVPTVTIRDTTERPETVDCGSNIVTTIDANKIIKGIFQASTMSREWNYPEGYTEPKVSDNVIKLLLGN